MINEMKKFIFLMLSGLMMGFGIRYPHYQWEQVVKPGNGSFQENWKEGKWPMGIMPLIGFENKLWMIGQKLYWSSENGINWNANTKTDWGERHGMAIVYFKDKFWMFGGMRSWDDFRNDIWVSSNGKQWQKVNDHAVWEPRRDHKVIIFKDKLWLIGGAISSGKANQTPTQFLNDVWSSTDGINWALEQENAPWKGSDNLKSLVFRDKIWIIGGGESNDVWNYSGGKQWEQISSHAPWKQRRGNGVLVFDDELWTFGGINHNDVWHSPDGKEWKKMNEPSPWSSRSTEYSIAFKNKLWIFSGKTGRADSWAGDIWTLSSLIK